MPIKTQEALKAMNQKDKPFSISFFTREGKRVFLPHAIKCGLPPDLRSNKNLIGVDPQVKGRHTYAVHQKLITTFNGQQVVY